MMKYSILALSLISVQNKKLSAEPSGAQIIGPSTHVVNPGSKVQIYGLDDTYFVSDPDQLSKIKLEPLDNFDQQYF